MKSYTVVIEEDDEGNLVLPLPEELFNGDHPWMPDDIIVWEVDDNGVTTLTNKSWLIRNENGFG
jgi:hypothetical protein